VRVAIGSSAVVGSRVALARITSGVAEAARIRGFAAPAFARCAFFVECRVELHAGTLPVKTPPDHISAAYGTGPLP
jgi:hypothetical protein